MVSRFTWCSRPFPPWNLSQRSWPCWERYPGVKGTCLEVLRMRCHRVMWIVVRGYVSVISGKCVVMFKYPAYSYCLSVLASYTYSCRGYHLGNAFELKGNFTQKWKFHKLVVFGALSRMVKVRSACDKLFWVYKRLNKLGRPRAGILMTF